MVRAIVIAHVQGCGDVSSPVGHSLPGRRFSNPLGREEGQRMCWLHQEPYGDKCSVPRSCQGSWNIWQPGDSGRLGNILASQRIWVRVGTEATSGSGQEDIVEIGRTRPSTWRKGQDLSSRKADGSAGTSSSGQATPAAQRGSVPRILVFKLCSRD